MRYVCPAVSVALAIVAPIVVSAQGLSITSYQLINQQAIGASQFDLTYSAVLVNSGPALGSVTATLSSNNIFSFRALPTTSTLNFSPVPANGQVASSNTFTVLSSTSTLDFTQIQWTFQTTAAGPIANAGPNQTAAVGSTVTLNGSASTTPSGILSYSWRFLSRPPGTSSVLTNWTTLMPSFVVDVAGTYVITLTVSNGSQSSSSNVTVSTTITPPVANAGPNQTVSEGATALLNGSGSTDVDGNPLTFSWTMTSRPTGSTAALLGATTVTPSFVVDQTGSYTVQLIVNDGFNNSTPSQVTISSVYSAPVASAGAGQVVTVGTQVQLNGSGSSDTDSHALTYQWSLITKPSGSAAALSSATAENPTFTADQMGTYVAQLTVNDGISNSNPSTVTITTIAVLPPTANAGTNQTVTTGSIVSLNGSGTDPQPLQITYVWSWTTKPAGSKATLSSATIANPTFTADLPGTYIAQLIVNNGTLSSSPSTVTITAAAPTGLEVPVSTVVAPGQSVSLSVTLGAPAPAGGLFVSLASSNTSVATVTAAFIIPAGAMAPVTTPKLNGIGFGSVTITATAVGLPPATGTAQVTETLSFSPSSLAIAGLTKGQLYLFIPQGAPAPGVTLNVSSSNTAVATVPSTVTIGTGATYVNVPVTGISYGSTVIQASGSNFVSATANVTVSAAVATGPPTIAVVSGTNQSAQINTAFSAPFVVVVKDSNSNPISGATVTFAATATAASGTFAGGATTAITNTSGIATSAAFSANGTVGIYYVSASVTGAVTPAAFLLTNVSAAPSGSTTTTTTPTVGAAPALVAHQAFSQASSSCGYPTCTTPPLNTSSCAPNCLLAVCLTSSPASLPSNPLTDSLKNLWVNAGSVQETDDTTTTLWFAVAATVGTAQTFTTGDVQGGPAMSIMAFSGVASGPDKFLGSPGYTNPFTVGPLTPTNNNELIISCAGSYPTSISGVSGLTLVDNIPYNNGYSGNYTLGSAYQVQTTATPVTAGWSVGPTSGTSALISSFYSTLSPAPLAVTTTSLPEGFNKTAYSVQLQANGGVGPFTWTLTSGTLPTGLSLTTSGLISGTPTQTIANVALTFKVTDSNSSTASSSGLALTIASAALAITTTSCPAGTQYAAYAGCNIAAVGGTSPYKYSFITSNGYASLPEGLALNSATGAITSAQIGGQGTYFVDFIVTDANGATASQPMKIGMAGSNAFLASIFPSNSIFHHRVDAASTGLPVDASPAAPIYSAYQSQTIKPFFGNAPVGATPNGIPAIQVPYNQAGVSVTTTVYQSYFTSGPIPANAPVEDASSGCDYAGGGNDCHVIVYREAGGGNPPALYEMWNGQLLSGGSNWRDYSNALWTDVTSNALTPQGTGTTDAAGLPIAPLLLNADEVIGTGTSTSPNGTVQHPTRFTLNNMLHYWVWPATDTAGVGTCTTSAGASVASGTQISQSSPPSACTMTGPAGEIYRLKASVAAPACASTSPQANIIITGMRNYGIILADNGISGGLIGTPDTRWNDSDLACLGKLTLSDFEPVNVSSLIVSNASGQTSK